MGSLYRSAEKQLRKFSDPEFAVKNKRYLKSPFKFYGVSKKDINKIGRIIYRKNKAIDSHDLKVDLEDLWNSNIHELKTMAIVLAGLFIRRINPDWIEDVFEDWVCECQGWDHLDELCVKVIGVLLIHDPSLTDKVFSWSSNENKWVRRASLIPHLTPIRQRKADFEVIEQTCFFLAPDEDFFIRKAIGWVLRVIGDTNRNIAIEMIGRLGPSLSRLSFREATRKLNEKEFNVLQRLLNKT